MLAAEQPGRIRDISSDGTWLWVATERGLVRWRIGALLP